MRSNEVGNRNNGHEEKVERCVIRGRGANGAPEFFTNGREDDVLWPVRVRRRVSDPI